MKMTTLPESEYRFRKRANTARSWLQGASEFAPEYFKVLEVMDFAQLHHNGVRNGGDPDFIHQVNIFLRMTTLHKSLTNPVLVYMLIFGHDMVEDPNPKTKGFINPAEVRERWGDVYSAKVLKMSKIILGQPNPNYSLDAIFADEDCGPAKLGDRDDNVSTMEGVFTEARKARYLTETRDEFVARIPAARTRFPRQKPVYESYKTSLERQLALHESLDAARQAGKMAAEIGT